MFDSFLGRDRASTAPLRCPKARTMARLNLILMNVTLATFAIALFQRLTGFSPLILFVVPPTVVLRTTGFSAALAAAALGATVGD